MPTPPESREDGAEPQPPGPGDQWGRGLEVAGAALVLVADAAEAQGQVTPAQIARGLLVVLDLAVLLARMFRR